MKTKALVYVVDDESLIASTLAAVLIDCGYNVEWFTSPLNALAAVELRAPDILVSDVIMPHLTGVELAVRVIDTCPGCSVLFMSVLDSIDEMLAAAGVGNGEFLFLAKPFHPGVLLQAIQHPLREFHAP